MNTELVAEIQGWFNASSTESCTKCTRVGAHAVCGKCGAHADQAQLHDYTNCGSCGAKAVRNYYRASTPFVATATKLSQWDRDFLLSVENKLQRGWTVSPKMMAVVDKIRIRMNGPAATTSERDAIDCCPKRGRTLKAVCEALGYYPTSFHNGEGVNRDEMQMIRADFRARVYDETGWEKLPDSSSYADALKVLPAKSKIAKALFALFDYHAWMVRTGRFIEAA